MEERSRPQDEQIEQARQMCSRLGEQVQASADAMAEAFRPVTRQIVEFLRPITKRPEA